MENKIYFDMDGTIADLYSVKGWLELLRSNSELPYQLARPMYDYYELAQAIQVVQQAGFSIGIISWCSKDSNKEFDDRIRKAKREWLKKNFPFANEIHIVKYGTPKHKVVKEKNAILVDDENKNLSEWTRGRTIDAKENLIKKLYQLVEG